MAAGQHTAAMVTPVLTNVLIPVLRVLCVIVCVDGWFCTAADMTCFGSTLAWLRVAISATA
jgi:hypothetical protein